MNKIGMYTDDEILNFMTEGEGRGFLGRSMYDAIRETIEEKDKEIERLNKELKLKTDFIEELLTIISVARDYELHDKCYTRSKIYQDKLKALKEGK